MPVLTKTKHTKLYCELQNRIEVLCDQLRSRELKKGSEGLTRGCWQRPDEMCATKGDVIDISMAIEDFKTILAEFKKLK